MNTEHFNSDRRHERAIQRLGCDHPRCQFCLMDNPICLELHHISGRAFGDQTIPICRNCHRIITDKQKDHPASVSNPPDRVEQIARFILGIADLLQMLGAHLATFARELIEHLSSRVDVSVQPS